jgi:hypothetical protein
MEPTMQLEVAPEDIESIECRHAVYCPPTLEGDSDDLHLIKEVIHTKDGRTIPNVRFVRNYKRPFWVAKKGLRKYHDKKEWEDESRLTKFMTTQTKLQLDILKALDQGWQTPRGLRKIARSPYLYGADILSTAVIKREYMDKFETRTKSTVAVFDTETNVLDASNNIIIATLSFKERVFTAIDKKFLEGYPDVINQLREAMTKYLGDVVEKRKIKWEVVLVDGPADIVVKCLAKAHEWKPDFFAIWNMDFDVQRMTEALHRAGLEAKDYFSDPAVPKEFRHFEYKQGPSQKVTVSGKVTPIKPAARWHTVYTPASFYIIDAMCAYKHIRIGTPEEPSYALDPILEKRLGKRKLKFEEASEYTGLKWHEVMQARYRIQYVIYNVWDCVSIEELDETTNDLSFSLPLGAGCSDYANFKSQPRRLVDELHYFCLQNGKVIGTTSDDMETELDKHTVGVDDWIVMLPAHLVMDNGLQIVEEDPTIRTNIRAHTGDLDVAAAYPNNGSVLNISKETTSKEMVRIVGVTEQDQRLQGINLSGGHTNAVEFVTKIYKAPGLQELLDAFKEDMKLV